MLTNAGELLLARAPKLLDTLSNLHTEIATLEQSPLGRLCIACTPTFGQRQIIPLLPSLQARYPQLQIELELTERPTDPTQHHLDAIIKMGTLEDSRLYSQRLGTQQWSICASPDYLKQHGFPATLLDITPHRLLDKRHDPMAIGWQYLRNAQLISPQATNNAVRCNDYTSLLACAEGGLGLSYLPTWVTQQSVQEGRLVTVFKDPAQRKEDIYILRPLPYPSAKLAVFTQALSDKWQQSFAGILP